MNQPGCPPSEFSILTLAWLVLISFILSASLTSAATNPIQIDPEAQFIDLSAGMLHLEDPNGTLDLAAINKQYRANFFKPGDPNLGISPSAFWFRFALVNTGSQPILRWLDTGTRTLQEIDLYYSDALGRFERISTGSKVGFAQRPVPATNLVLPLQLPPNRPIEIYMRVRSTGALGVTMLPRLWQPDVLQHQSKAESAKWTFMVGFGVALGILNLIVFAYTRDLNNALYTLHVGGTLWAVSSTLGGFGSAFEYLWPDWPVFEQVGWLASPFVMGIFQVVFIAYLLEFWRYKPRLIRLIWFLLGIAGVSVCFQVVVTAIQLPDAAGILQKAQGAGALLNVVVNIALIYGVASAVAQRNRSAKFVTVAFLPGLLVIAYESYGAATSGTISWEPILYAIVFEWVIMALAVADRYYQIRRDLDRAESELRNHAEILKARVAERTFDLQKANSDLTAAKTAADMGSVAKTRFLAAASHDLRQPLQAISLFVESLSRTPLNQEQKHITHYLKESSRSLGDLLDILLDISKLDAGAIKPEPAVIPVDTLMSKIEAEFSALAAKKSLRFKLFFPFDDMALYTDPKLLLSLLGNMIGNAIKYTEQGGLLVAIRRRGTQALVQVWDTGSGIAPEHLDNIFEEFFQVDNPERDKTKGLGLGLAIVRRIGKLLGTEVRCLSRPGKGSVFELYLPLATSGEVSPSPLGDPTEATFSAKTVGRHIVLVEDDLTVGIATKLALESCGMTVTHYKTTEEALADPDIAEADFYISDMRLPGKSGIEFLDALQQRATKPIKAVLLTGDTAVNRIEMMQSKSWSMLFKPVDLASLLAVIEAQGSVK